jgi:glycosyltransferase involved in cell wall biosynthesis
VSLSRFIKKLLPEGLKSFLWFVVKSPQRSFVGYGTLFTDFRAWFKLKFGSAQLEKITVCTGLKNRSDNYLKHLLNSLNKCDNKELISLSVFDCGSDDIENLEKEIRKEWNGKLVFNSEEINFSRSYSFNKAVHQSNDPIIFVCDADIAVPSDLVVKCNNYVTKRSAWFPILFFEDEQNRGEEVTIGKFRTEGKGIFASKRDHFISIGGYDESITEWGDEDWKLFFDFYKNGIKPHRTKERHLIHRYHKSLRPPDFNSIYAR